jgi:cobalamin biosynthesis protein CbiG
VTRYVVGVGLASAATPDELAGLVATALAEAGIGPADVAAVATVEARAAHHAVTALGWPVVPVALPAASGPGARPAVAEPAALAAAGDGAFLVVPKRRSARATAAVARIAGVTASGR